MDKSKKKIAVVVPKYGLVGGAERFAYELTERVALDERFDMHVFANKWESHSKQVTFHRVPIIRFPRSLSLISFAYFAGRKMSKIDFHIIHTHERIFTADIFTMHGIPHRIWVDEVRRKRRSVFDQSLCWVEKCLINSTRCKSILPVSILTKEKLLQEYDVRADRIQVIHPGVDMTEFQMLDKEQCRREMRKHFGIDCNDVVILFVSMNFDIKGLDYVMAAVAKAKRSYPAREIKLLVVGKGDYKKYSALATTEGIKDSVIFAGIQRENLKKIYLACDIFMMLSRFDTFGMTVLEAMAASLPVIISSTVGARDLVVEGQNGYVIEDASNTDMIRDRIGYMLDQDTHMRMARKARDTALKNDWDAVAARVRDVYEKSCGTSP
jgi:UDP-glucose:(heptosyl)LPS alpha-1,3-glucosyltransferase